MNRSLLIVFVFLGFGCAHGLPSTGQRAARKAENLSPDGAAGALDKDTGLVGAEASSDKVQTGKPDSKGTTRLDKDSPVAGSPLAGSQVASNGASSIVPLKTNVISDIDALKQVVGKNPGKGFVQSIQGSVQLIKRQDVLVLTTETGNTVFANHPRVADAQCGSLPKAATADSTWWHFEGEDSVWLQLTKEFAAFWYYDNMSNCVVSTEPFGPASQEKNATPVLEWAILHTDFNGGADWSHLPDSLRQIIEEANREMNPDAFLEKIRESKPLLNHVVSEQVVERVADFWDLGKNMQGRFSIEKFVLFNTRNQHILHHLFYNKFDFESHVKRALFSRNDNRQFVTLETYFGTPSEEESVTVYLDSVVYEIIEGRGVLIGEDIYSGNFHERWDWSGEDDSKKLVRRYATPFGSVDYFRLKESRSSEEDYDDSDANVDDRGRACMAPEGKSCYRKMHSETRKSTWTFQPVNGEPISLFDLDWSAAPTDEIVYSGN